MRDALLAVALSALLFGSALVIVQLPGVSAWVPTENTWISDDDGLASDGGNWENGSLFMDQVLWFTGSHNGNCTWNFIAVNMAWGTNINRFAAIIMQPEYNGSIMFATYIFLYQGIIPYPIDPGPDPHYPGPFDWLTMSNSQMLLLMILAGGMIFLLSLAIMSRRR